jgi:hypothetical protein
MRRPHLVEEPSVRDDGLQLDEDRGLQERLWTIERLAHVLMALLVLAGLAGLAGAGGWLSQGREETATAVVDFPRFPRWDTGEEVDVRFKEPREVHRVELSGPVHRRWVVEEVSPPPLGATATAEGLALEFESEAAEGITVTLRLSARRPGPARLMLAADGAEAGTLRMFVLP